MVPPSILHPGSAPTVLVERQPACFPDLHLDRIVAAILAGREEYHLDPWFWSPVRDVATVAYRHEVFRDLDRTDVAAAVGRFAAGMRTMRAGLTWAGEATSPEARHAWFLDAVRVYCETTTAFASALDRLTLRSRGLRAFRDALADRVRSDRFASLSAEASDIVAALEKVRYTVLVDGRKVRVRRSAGEVDMGAAVAATFARFGEGAPREYRVEFRDGPPLDHVEARILGLVAKLFPAPFHRLAAFVAAWQDFAEPLVVTFDREVQFYLAVIEFLAPLRRAGLEFCFPEVTASDKAIRARGTFDLALAARLVPQGREIVRNDFLLEGPERILVVTGPNQGGKTTFARTFGQLHHLAGLGCPVPGEDARLFLPDAVFTHFAREEQVATLRGRLQDELVRIRNILAAATDHSIVVMNETLASTTLTDARDLGERILRRLIRRDLLGVYVTFVDELSTLDEATVSVVAGVAPDDPSVRTFRIERRPADGLAYAAAIAAKYRLGGDDLRRRLGC